MHPEHQPDGHVGQRLELSVGLLGVGEEPLEDLQQDLVADVEQVGHPGGQRVGDQRYVARRARAAGRSPRSPGGPGRSPGWPRASAGTRRGSSTNWPKWASRQCPRGPSPCSRISSIARCALARSVTATSSGQPKCCRGRLGARRPDEQPVLAVHLGEVGEARPRSTGRGARPSRSPGRAERCPARSASAPPGRRRARPSASARSMPSGRSRNMKCRSACSPNGSKRQLHAGRVVIGGLRQVRPGHVRRGADRRQQVVHQGQVEHLLGRHVRRSLAASAGPRPARRRPAPRSPCLSENAANRYWHMMPCSSSAASHSM